MSTTSINESDVRALVTQILAALSPGNDVSSAATPRAAAELERPATPADRLAVPNPANRAAYLQMLELTPARIGEWRADPRPTVKSLLRFRADHAGAMDAVFSDVNPQLLSELGLFCVQSAATDKASFLMDPNIGARFTPGGGRPN